MKVFLNFLVELFTLISVWVERGHGRWVLSRRMHPALRAFLTISLMIFGIAWGLNHFMGVPAPETPRAQIPSELQPQAHPLPQVHDDRPLD